MSEPSEARIEDAASPPIVPSASEMIEQAAKQVPPADELHEVRQRIADLKDRESALRSLILSDPEARTGNRFLAEIKEVETSRTDWTELKAAHPGLIEEYTYPATDKRVELFAITEDGEIVRPPRRRRT